MSFLKPAQKSEKDEVFPSAPPQPQNRPCPLLETRLNLHLEFLACRETSTVRPVPEPVPPIARFAFPVHDGKNEYVVRLNRVEHGIGKDAYKATADVLFKNAPAVGRDYDAGNRGGHSVGPNGVRVAGKIERLPQTPSPPRDGTRASRGQQALDSAIDFSRWDRLDPT